MLSRGTDWELHSYNRVLPQSMSPPVRIIRLRAKMVSHKRGIHAQGDFLQSLLETTV